MRVKLDDRIRKEQASGPLFIGFAFTTVPLRFIEQW
jgi:hypothetical protein